MNVPPALPSESVTVSVVTPVGVRVKFPDGWPTYAEPGATSVKLTAPVELYHQGLPVTPPPSPDVSVRVLVPAEAGVYVKVWAADEFVKVRLVGVNVPPPELSDRRDCVR